MKKTNSNNISQLNDVLSSVDVQHMLLSRAKNSVLATAIELMGKTWNVCVELYLPEKVAITFVTEVAVK